jgi:hypothetical protein
MSDRAAGVVVAQDDGLGGVWALQLRLPGGAVAFGEEG